MAANSYSVSSTAAARATDLGKTSGLSGTSVSEREDLANFISMITRDETPFMSSIGKTKATAIFHEWQTDALAAPGNSKQADGADYTEVGPGFSAGATANTLSGTAQAAGGATQPVRSRFGNYTQINAKTLAVSGTKRVVDQAGVADEYAYQLKKRGTELRRDVEMDLVSNQQSDGDGTRAFGGYMSWIQHPIGTAVLGSPTGTVKYKNTVDGTTSAGVNVAAPGSGAGTGRVAISLGSGSRVSTFELEDIDDVMQAIYEAGGKATTVMVSPKNRRVFSAKAQASTGGLIQGTGTVNTRRNIDESGSLRQSVDMYMSDFGEIMIQPNYIMGLFPAQPASTVATAQTALPRDYAAFVYDPMWFNIATLRPMQEVDVGQRGDSTVGMIVEECTLEVRNPIGCGAVYGLSGS